LYGEGLPPARHLRPEEADGVVDLVYGKRKKRFFIWISRRGAGRLTLAAAAVALFAVLFTSDYSSTDTWSHWSMPLAGRTVVIDAGHGGVDGGARSADGLIEKEVALELAMQVRDYLQQAGAFVVMTREGDYDLARPDTRGLSRRKTEDLLARADILRKADADLFLTIHLNSTPSSRWRGAQTFYYPGREESRRLAVFIQQELRENLANTTRQANTAPSIYLLKTSPVPAALVEVGFLSNPEEAKLLTDDEYRRKLAASIYRGVLRFVSGEPIADPVH
jgi:N-acetylmuramoyl-L-alanine amidase